MGIGQGLGYAVEQWEKQEEERLRAEEKRVLDDVNGVTPYTYEMGSNSAGTIGDAESALLDSIASNEGTGDKYDVAYNYQDYGKTKPLTEMTLNEVLDYQDNMKAYQGSYKIKSTAVGRYQMLNKVLKEEMKRGGFTGTELFDEATQNKLIMQRLKKKRGYDKWSRGELSDKDFKKNLSREFASIVDPYTGVGHYGQGAKEIVW